MERVKLKIRVVNIFESGIIMKGEDGELYFWHTRNYNTKLFFATQDEWYTITARKFIYDHPTPKNGLKYVRIVKEN